MSKDFQLSLSVVPKGSDSRELPSIPSNRIMLSDQSGSPVKMPFMPYSPQKKSGMNLDQVQEHVNDQFSTPGSKNSFKEVLQNRDDLQSLQEKLNHSLNKVERKKRQREFGPPGSPSFSKSSKIAANYKSPYGQGSPRELLTLPSIVSPRNQHINVKRRMSNLQSDLDQPKIGILVSSRGTDQSEAGFIRNDDSPTIRIQESNGNSPTDTSARRRPRRKTTRKSSFALDDVDTNSLLSSRRPSQRLLAQKQSSEYLPRLGGGDQADLKRNGSALRRKLSLRLKRQESMFNKGMRMLYGEQFMSPSQFVEKVHSQVGDVVSFMRLKGVDIQNEAHMKELMKQGTNIKEYFRKKSEDVETKRRAHAEVIEQLRDRLRERFVTVVEEKAMEEAKRANFGRKKKLADVPTQEATYETLEHSTEGSVDGKKEARQSESFSNEQAEFMDFKLLQPEVETWLKKKPIKIEGFGLSKEFRELFDKKTKKELAEIQRQKDKSNKRNQQIRIDSIFHQNHQKPKQNEEKIFRTINSKMKGVRKIIEREMEPHKIIKSVGGVQLISDDEMEQIELEASLPKELIHPEDKLKKLEKQESKLSLKTLPALARGESATTRGRLPDHHLIKLVDKLDKGVEKYGIDGRPLSSDGEMSIPSSSHSIYKDLDTRLQKVYQRDESLLQEQAVKKRAILDKKCPARDLHQLVSVLTKKSDEISLKKTLDQELQNQIYSKRAKLQNSKYSKVIQRKKL